MTILFGRMMAFVMMKQDIVIRLMTNTQISSESTIKLDRVFSSTPGKYVTMQGGI